VIVVLCFAIGLVLRLASGRKLGDLADAGLRGESVLLVLLVLQILPAWIPLTGSLARIAYLLWLATFPCMAFVAWLNRKQPGMAVLGFGLLLNFAVIATNGGMPVAANAIASITPSANAVHIAPTDFVHVPVDAGTRLIWLADVIPIAGPSWLRSVASAGDCLLFVGIATFLATAQCRGAKKPRPV